MDTPARRRMALATLCAAQFMLVLDVVVVNVAIPTIRDDLGIAHSQIQLTGICYTLTFGSLLVVAGRVGDLVGHRRLLLAGLAVFTAASVAAGAATGGTMLFVARAAQGIGAAMASPTALALITGTFTEGPERNRALGLWGAVGSSGAIAGQLVGGVLTDLVSWRAVFLVNVPIGVVALALAGLTLDEHRVATSRSRLDIGGTTLLVLGLAAAIVGLARIPERGLDATAVVPLAAAGAALAAFVAWERRHAHPLVRFGLFRTPGVRVGNVTLLLNAGALGATLFFTTLYLQGTLGYSALDVGAAYTPVTIAILVISSRAERLTARYGVRRLLTTGLVLITAGIVLLAPTPGDGTYLTAILPGLALVAVGSGLAYAPTFIAGTTGVDDDEGGLASGLLTTSQEIGAALGLALLATVAATVTAASDVPGSAAARVGGYRAGLVGAAVLTAAAATVARSLRPDAPAGDRRPAEGTPGPCATARCDPAGATEPVR
jgi:EmrB/QacA subfamily drug resistance transporter